ncbi:hypothetical protein BC833DRAFT_579749 [Globomyces pollinis-pini]|nr:hypothetical protein BC833DRAFT_579749 [Globomyces pollinis-pini]
MTYYSENYEQMQLPAIVYPISPMTSYTTQEQQHYHSSTGYPTYHSQYYSHGLTGSNSNYHSMDDILRDIFVPIQVPAHQQPTQERIPYDSYPTSNDPSDSPLDSPPYTNSIGSPLESLKHDQFEDDSLDKASKAVYRCTHENCTKAYSRQYTLKMHVSTVHEKYRPFQCDFNGCTKSFARRHDLKRHKNIHNVEGKYSCHHCSERFAKKDQLKSHIKSGHIAHNH